MNIQPIIHEQSMTEKMMRAVMDEFVKYLADNDMVICAHNRSAHDSKEVVANFIDGYC